MGSGDLHLHPHDMARFGYLWLHRGERNGKQDANPIASRSVEAASNWNTRSIARSPS
jgi:hypothetical protein